MLSLHVAQKVLSVGKFFVTAQASVPSAPLRVASHFFLAPEALSTVEADVATIHHGILQLIQGGIVNMLLCHVSVLTEQGS